MQIDIEALAKTYAAARALHPVTLAVPSAALLAPSGSGKTTLLRILGGLEVPDGGRVPHDGRDAACMSVQERRAGFVFLHYALFRHMTVFENVACGLRGRPRRERPDAGGIAERVNRLLALVQLPQIGGR